MNAESSPTGSPIRSNLSIDVERRARVFRFAVSLTKDRDIAEDLTQEACLRSIQSVKNESEIRQVDAWLFRIVRNLWIDRCRRSHVQNTNSVVDVHELAGWTQGPSELTSQREELAQCLAAMLELPGRQREVLHLHVVEQMTIDEIASTLELTRNNVKASLSLARKRMRERMQPSNSHESQP